MRDAGLGFGLKKGRSLTIALGKGGNYLSMLPSMRSGWPGRGQRGRSTAGEAHETDRRPPGAEQRQKLERGMPEIMVGDVLVAEVK